MRDRTYSKILMLQQEVVAAVNHGPRRHLADVLHVDGDVVMYDASHLARELLPEASLHFSRVYARGEPICHTLRYVVVRATNEVIMITESALDSWLMSNAGVQREMQLVTAIELIRKSIASLSPEQQKRAYRHLRLLNQELTAS